LTVNFQVLERNQHEGRCTIINQVQGLIQGALFETLGHYDETVGGLIAFPQAAPECVKVQIRELSVLPLSTEPINFIPRQTRNKRGVVEHLGYDVAPCFPPLHLGRNKHTVTVNEQVVDVVAVPSRNLRPERYHRLSGIDDSRVQIGPILNPLLGV